MTVIKLKENLMKFAILINMNKHYTYVNFHIYKLSFTFNNLIKQTIIFHLKLKFTSYYYFHRIKIIFRITCN